MRAKRTTPEAQLELVEACRQSGLTDAEWCRQEGIKQSTFYTWVRRLQAGGMIDTPALVPSVVHRKPAEQDIVKIEITEPQAVIPPKAADTYPVVQSAHTVLEMNVEGVQLRISNEVDRPLLADIIGMLRGVYVR